MSLLSPATALWAYKLRPTPSRLPWPETPTQTPTQTSTQTSTQTPTQTPTQTSTQVVTINHILWIPVVFTLIFLKNHIVLYP